ncbi:MAG: murein transglycosylase [Tardiphaga sp.]|jgi:soluble lytic murein transglycosylase-like protein|nr:murein transglycosylase [Tardiphaga sp.]
MAGSRAFNQLLAVMLVLAAMSAGPLSHAASDTGAPKPAVAAPGQNAVKEDAAKPAGESRLSRSAIRAIVEQEAQRVNLPPDIAEAVVRVESSFDPSTIGSVGEIGLMQVRPGTAAMLGFKGSTAELAKPEINIHYGVIYLGKAWRLANGDLCRALMKYRAGHGEETMSPLSVTYCNRARGHLASLGSPFATLGATGPVLPTPAAAPKASASWTPASPTGAYQRFRQGTPAASRAFWASHEARIRDIKARLAAKWHRVASR